MNIAVLGAAGRIGGHVARRAVAQDWNVRGFCLPSESPGLMHPRLSVYAGDARNSDQVLSALRGQDAVVLAVGSRCIDCPHTLHAETVRSTLAAMREVGLSRVIAVLGAGILDHPSGVPAGCFKTLDTPTAWLEDYLQAHELLVHADSVSWTLVCPAFMSDGQPLGRYRVMANRLPEGGRNIEAADVADFILKEIAAPQFEGARAGIAY